jgi:alanine racemase
MMSSPHPTLEVDLAAIQRNYRLLQSRLKTGQAAGVVKADAYGLGAPEVARALQEAGCRIFFVATCEEGMALRHALREAQIFVFHGARPGENEDFAEHRLIPVLNDPAQAASWAESGPYALHIDTGMHRLGFSLSQARQLRFRLPPLLVMSHLACAGEPEHPCNAQQLQAFQRALRLFPGLPASLANSSGLFLDAAFHHDLARPGCALYGISPNRMLPNPMEPVARLSAPVLQYRTLEEDGSIGYGATAQARKGAVLATVELGYADGLFRSLSNRMQGYAGDIPLPILGRISMDMTVVDVSALPEDWRTPQLRITFIHEKQTVDDLAEAAGTIGYEIFTRLGKRVKRRYLNNIFE